MKLTFTNITEQEFSFKLSKNDLRFLLLTNRAKIIVSFIKNVKYNTIQIVLQSLHDEKIWYDSYIKGEKPIYKFLRNFSGEKNVFFDETKAKIAYHFSWINLIRKSDFENEDGRLLNKRELVRMVENKIGKKYKIK